IWPSLIDAAVKAEKDPIKDRAQVRLLAKAFAQLPSERLAAMLDVETDEEGWILGAGFEQELLRAAMPLTPPRLKNDCFALPPAVDWTPVDEALGRLKERLQCVVPAEERPTISVGGMVLAEDTIAKRSNPPAANPAVDGFGFAHASLGTGDQVLPLIEGRAAAGGPFAGQVPKGSAIRILTGALLPDGVDTVVLEEDTTTDGAQIAFEGGVRKGANARSAGEDVAGGDTILTAGTRLGPTQLALLAATGVTRVSVYRPLRVAVLSTGDEIVASGATDNPARTYDANRPMLLSMIEDWQMEPINLGHVIDEPEILRRELDEGAEKADVILTSGGASAGDEDHVSRLLGDTGTR
ncbi:MAG: molybdopterin-binding protein, partial [Marinomonas sp.]